MTELNSTDIHKLNSKLIDLKKYDASIINHSEEMSNEILCSIIR